MEYDVTIGIPVYNIEKYVENSIVSALSQTQDNIEIIVLDDCGTDGSMDIVRKLQREHPRGRDLRIVRQPHNCGLGEARNRIIEEARGKYLFHLDGDDAISHDTIEILYKNACRYKAEIVYGSFEIVEENHGILKRTPKPNSFGVFCNKNEWPNYVYSGFDIIPSSTCNFLISLDVYKKNNLHHLPINFWEDHTFTIDLPTYITRAVILPDITYFYYFRNGSLSNFQKRAHIQKSEIETTIDAMDWVKSNSDRIRQESYFPLRMKKVMMTEFYIACSILRNRSVITPEFTNKEIALIMNPPLALKEILYFKQARLFNLFFYILSLLPNCLSITIVKVIGKYKKLL